MTALACNAGQGARRRPHRRITGARSAVCRGTAGRSASMDEDVHPSRRWHRPRSGACRNDRQDVEHARRGRDCCLVMDRAERAGLVVSWPVVGCTAVVRRLIGGRSVADGKRRARHARSGWRVAEGAGRRGRKLDQQPEDGQPNRQRPTRRDRRIEAAIGDRCAGSANGHRSSIHWGDVGQGFHVQGGVASAATIPQRNLRHCGFRTSVLAYHLMSKRAWLATGVAVTVS